MVGPGLRPNLDVARPARFTRPRCAALVVRGTISRESPSVRTVGPGFRGAPLQGVLRLRLEHMSPPQRRGSSSGRRTLASRRPCSALRPQPWGRADSPRRSGSAPPAGLPTRRRWAFVASAAPHFPPRVPPVGVLRPSRRRVLKPHGTPLTPRRSRRCRIPDPTGRRSGRVW